MGHYLPADEHLGVLTPRFKDWLRDCLNACQWDCVERICSKTSPRLSLLQGPPGTGKTRVTLALLNCFILMRFHSHSQSLIKVLDVQSASKSAAAAAASDKSKKNGMVPVRPGMQPIHRNYVIPRPHILVCAPSNAAVDELLLRITSCNTELRDFGCNVFRPPVVRVGNSEMMSDSIMNVSLDSQVDKYLHMKFNEVKAKLDELIVMMAKKQFEIRLLEQEYCMLPHLVESFKKVIIDLKEDEHNYELQMARLRVCIECMTANKANTLAACHKNSLYTAKSVLESSLLDEAMVVFTTLTSAGRDSLASVNFDVVLIDEACQSVELETLIPLCLGAKRCVLIGDPQQLPATVISSSLLYRRSLFDRMQASGVELFMLTQQYRMHAEICLFPSQYFYFANLVCDESVGRRAPLPRSQDQWLPPFVVFNISSSSTRAGSGFMNKDEVSFVQVSIIAFCRFCQLALIFFAVVHSTCFAAPQ
jgi:senataxin